MEEKALKKSYMLYISENIPPDLFNKFLILNQGSCYLHVFSTCASVLYQATHWEKCNVHEISNSPMKTV